jgi:hypothetical protein
VSGLFSELLTLTCRAGLPLLCQELQPEAGKDLEELMIAAFLLEELMPVAAFGRPCT